MIQAKKTAILTGATGFLGSHLMARLLRQGYHVKVLGRPGNNQSLAKRISNLLNWLRASDFAGQITPFETEFGKPCLGLNRADYAKLCADGSPVIHCAADTSFAERNKERVMSLNVLALDKILELVIDGRVSYFHYLSTAYAVGDLAGAVPELPVSETHFNNVYEESKALAEKKISQFCENFSVPYTIIRPAIVYGDSETGRALKFKALYFPVKAIQAIKEIYLNDLQNNNGIKSAESGIFLDDDGCLNLPIRIFLPHKGFINLIPVGYFADAAMAVIKGPSAGKIYHVISSAPAKLEMLLKYTEKFLRVKGLKAVYHHANQNMKRNPPEELFDHFIKPYLPYLSDRRWFEKKNTDQVTGGAIAPELSYDIFDRCMEYARSVGWGKAFKDF